MICERCKANIPDIVKFCPKCGAKVEIAKVQETKKCPSCGTENPISAKFCKADGYNLQQAEEKPAEKPPEIEKPKDVIICPKCGTENPLTAKFCKKDGTPLKEEIKPPLPVEKEIKPEETVRPKIEVLPKVKIKKEEAKRPSKTWIWIAICGLVLIIAGVGSYLYFSGQIGKKPTEITAVPEIPKSPEPARPPKEVEKPITPQEPETKVVSPVMPAPEPPKSSVDIAKVERDLNMTLRNRGLSDVYAKVNKDLIAILKGTVNDPRDKMLASNIAESFTDLKGVRNDILVARKPLTPPVETPRPTPIPETPSPVAPRPTPIPETPSPALKIDPAKLEGDINRALRNAGIRGVNAEVSDDLDVALKGSVNSAEEKKRAFEIAKTFKEAKSIRDVIFVVEQ